MKKSKVLWILSGFLLALILAATAAYFAGFRYHPDIQQKIFADMVQSNAYKAALANLTADRVLQETAGIPLKTGKYPRTGSSGKAEKTGQSGSNRKSAETRKSGVLYCEWEPWFPAGGSIRNSKSGFMTAKN
ncbi:MAG: hypothetical protein V8T87_03110 [Victivallales bacterium]